MKQGKRPTRRQKELMSRAKLNPDNWLVVKNLLDCLHLKHRTTGKKRVLKASR
ncbi:hypothetical protein Dtox_4212 [Desulfofarcimen acetoxidans DSM 771]|uniref:DUF6906 domain-containing protein n=1 Tax=Desulfofarcimen acetoxidans (strain ATCC 49208 / DSM 771 / KCTC 5769 / VKM B-1644 / 5575) TaxID=485916 RepID=C8VZD4_DESAS|nr:hypothetical protein [Desulfofarcimen acetoxidans]ACV64879.1 hypothetical protein Dtox_4212 [Desulfofarcimen acetoxidans DSM 771]